MTAAERELRELREHRRTSIADRHADARPDPNLAEVPMFRRTPQTLVALTAALALAACDEPSRVVGPAPTPSAAGLAKAPASSLPRPVDISGGSFSRAVDVNTFGFAAGSRTDASYVTTPLLWLPSGTSVTLPVLGANGGWANAINDAGQVVGTSSSLEASGDNHAFVWTPGVGIRDIGTLRPGVVGMYSEATDINNRGWVVGYSELSGDAHAFLWTPDAGMRDLGTLGGAMSKAYAINDNGQVVGVSVNAAGKPRAFLWTAGRGMQELAPLAGYDWSQATGINNKGQIVGRSQSITATSNWLRAVVWTPKGAVQDLGFAPGVVNIAEATDINDAGQIVGSAQTFVASVGYALPQPFVWTASTGMRLLAVPSGTDGGVASGINNGGQVAGEAYVSTVGPRATLWR